MSMCDLWYNVHVSIILPFNFNTILNKYYGLMTVASAKNDIKTLLFRVGFTPMKLQRLRKNNLFKMLNFL